MTKSFSFISRLDVKDHMLLLEFTEVVEMKEGNMVAPYVFKKVSLSLFFLCFSMKPLI